MFKKKGFTLLEIIVVLIITGVLTALLLPSFKVFINNGAAQAAQNNLISIYQAQKTFYFTNGYFCSTSSQNTTCANNLANINTNLSLSISDTNFTYSCTDPLSGSDGNDGSSFNCNAQNTSDANLHLTLYGGTTAVPTPVVLIGGTNCATIAGTKCNPVCTTDNTNYCPTSSS